MAGGKKLTVEDVINKISLSLAYVGGVLLIIMMLAMIADAIGRKVIGSVPGALELSQGILAGILFLPQGYTELKRGHISVDIILRLLPERWQTALSFTSCLIAGSIFLFLTWLSFDKAIQSTLVREYSAGIINFPVWTTRWFIPVGSIALSLQFFLSAYQSLLPKGKGKAENSSASA